MTKSYKIENFEQTARERDLFMLALNSTLNQDVSFSSWCRETDGSEGRYRVGACRLHAADGGLLIVTYRHPNQGDYTTVQSRDGFATNGYINQPLLDAMREACDTWYDEHAAPIASAAIGPLPRMIEA